MHPADTPLWHICTHIGEGRSGKVGIPCSKNLQIGLHLHRESRPVEIPSWNWKTIAKLEHQAKARLWSCEKKTNEIKRGNGGKGERRKPQSVALFCTHENSMQFSTLCSSFKLENTIKPLGRKFFKRWSLNTKLFLCTYVRESLSICVCVSGASQVVARKATEKFLGNFYEQRTNFRVSFPCFALDIAPETAGIDFKFYNTHSNARM